MVKMIGAGDDSFFYGKSVSNQRIEAWWSILGKDCTSWWIDVFKDLRSWAFIMTMIVLR